MVEKAIKASLQQLPYEGLHNLVKDIELRIGSHVAGGDPVEQYVEDQKQLLGYVQEELERRAQCAK
jgi:hypothetical protein